MSVIGEMWEKRYDDLERFARLLQGVVEALNRCRVCGKVATGTSDDMKSYCRPCVEAAGACFYWYDHGEAVEDLYKKWSGSLPGQNG